MTNKNLFECQKECDINPNCNNIKFCETGMGKGCTLYDRVITKNTPQDTIKVNCITSFKTCPGGKCFYVFKAI